MKAVLKVALCSVSAGGEGVGISGHRHPFACLSCGSIRFCAKCSEALITGCINF